MRGNLIVVVLMLFMGVSVPDAANVCNESKVESYDTDINIVQNFMLRMKRKIPRKVTLILTQTYWRTTPSSEASMRSQKTNPT